MNKPTPKELLDIARAHLDSTLTTLKPRNNDGLDFHDVSCWGIENALLAAFDLGANKVIDWIEQNGCPDTAKRARMQISEEEE